MKEQPMIWIACLSAYNNGYLHGKWINLATYRTEEAVYAEIQKILASSPIGGAEEFAIHDYQYFGDVEIDEYESIKSVIKKAKKFIPC